MSWTPPGIWNPSAGSITPFSLEALGIPLASLNVGFTVASGNWPSGSQAIYVPFDLSAAVTVTAGFYYSGLVADNVDLGVYTFAGARIVSSGSTASATGFAVVNLTDTLLQAGRYYMAFVRSSTAATFRVAPATPLPAALGVKQQAGALPLPSTATFSDATSAYLPAFGLSISTVNQ